MVTYTTGDNNYGITSYIVDPTLGQGNYQNIGAALTAASAASFLGTIFIRPGTYIEDPNLVSGINLSAFPCDGSFNGTGKVIINGVCTLTTAGTVTISGVELQTNSTALLAVTGSAASIVNLESCYLNCSNNTGITFSSSSSSAQIMINNCFGNIGTTGITLFSHSSAGSLSLSQLNMTNSGLSSTASTISSGILNVTYSDIDFPITSSGTSAVAFMYNSVDTSGVNVTALTIGGSSNNNVKYNSISSGSASAVSVSSTGGAAPNFIGNIINSTNTNAITGSGAIVYSLTSFTGSSSLINTTTQTGGTIQGGIKQAPSAGYIGEQIRATVASPGNSISTNTATNLTSISLTAGNWDTSLVMGFSGATVVALVSASISTTSASLATAGDSRVDFTGASQASASQIISVPSYRLTLTSTTTVYAVGFTTYSAGTGTFFGRISATRVG